MSNADYRKAYETAASELEALLVDQEKRESRILALRRTLNVLSTLCQQEGMDTTDLDVRYAQLQEIVEGSLTTDIFRVVKDSNSILTASEIREELIKLGGSLTDNNNPLATIHAILNRLGDSGRLKEVIKDGKKAWTFDRSERVAKPITKCPPPITPTRSYHRPPEKMTPPPTLGGGLKIPK